MKAYPTLAYFGLAFALGCGSGSQSEEAAAVSGQAIFQATCAQCHGPRGLGDGPMAASLPTPPASLIDHLAHHTRAQLVQLVQGGIPPAMPPQALTAEQVEQVIDYIWTLVPADQVEALRAMQEAVESGAAMPMMPGMGGMEGVGGTEGIGQGAMPGMSMDSMPMDHSGH